MSCSLILENFKSSSTRLVKNHITHLPFGKYEELSNEPIGAILIQTTHTHKKKMFKNTEDYISKHTISHDCIGPFLLF